MQMFISVEEARSIVQAALPVLLPEPVALSEALGRVLATPILSREPLPPFDNSAMDGYAVRIADLKALPCTLAVAERLPAGVAPQRAVEPGTCAQIMTGAPLPRGADAIVPVEWTEAEGDDAVRVLRAPSPSQYVRPAGQDVEAGSCVFEAGTVVTPPIVGMLAALGRLEVSVSRQPRVAVVVTGDELVVDGRPLEAGQIRDANGPALAAQVRSAGALALGPWHAHDDRTHLEAVLDEVAEADVVLFSGGVSVGEHDHVKEVLEGRGLNLLFWKVRQRPGKPLAFGLLGPYPVFGLPGNPVSSAVCFEQYVRPTLARMMGRPAAPVLHRAVLEAATPKVAGLHHFARGLARTGADGRLYVRDTGPQASNLYTSVVQANCLIHLPEALEEASPGLEVDVEWLPWATYWHSGPTRALPGR